MCVKKLGLIKIVNVYTGGEEYIDNSARGIHIIYKNSNIY